MNFAMKSVVSIGLTIAALAISQPALCRAQEAQDPAPPTANDKQTSLPQLKNWTAAEDHQNMMDQLAIKALRPGPSRNENAPNHANYDESKANPFPNLPDALVLKNGQRITTTKIWWDRRRPEIIEDFEREVLGRIPPSVPKVSWSFTKTEQTTLGPYPVTVKELTGHVDNSAYPLISVDIQMTLVTPAKIEGRVPVMMMFRAVSPVRPSAPTQAVPALPPSPDPPAIQQLIGDGWGFAYIFPATIQADNGAGLTRGIIGLVNKGQPRKPEDWGALRAWAWGASRGLDYLETDPSVDANRVGIEGVSRYGKAALITMAFDTRFAVVLVGSSGEGGAKPHRRNWGEAVENLTGTGEYHWMAGNFLKYGASDAVFGSRNAGDIPVDSNELIALCAPRPTFISYGVPEKGDAKWLDQPGSFRAAVAAEPVFRLLGARDLGVTEDYYSAQMPPVGQGLLDGQLAWRQHEGGHTDAPNWRYFVPWADKFLHHAPSVTASIEPAGKGAPRSDANSLAAHRELLEKAKKGVIRIYFEGDSITRRWDATDYPALQANWKQNFFGWDAADFGWGADRIQNIVWRLENGELDGVNPRVIVLLAGTNNIGKVVPFGSDEWEIGDITNGIQTVLQLMRAKASNSTIILMGIFPRNDNMAVMPIIDKVNLNLAKLADGQKVRYLNINDKLADASGKLYDGMMNPDQLHPALNGYQVWADALEPIFTELLGPPAKEDHAPPATGNPGIRSTAMSKIQ